MVYHIPLLGSYIQGQGHKQRLNVVIACIPFLIGKDRFIFPW